MLKIQNLKKHFGGVKAVNDCSFTVKKNKITALIGPNGSGKSTVFNLISGVIKEDFGTILFDGINITDYSPEQVSNTGVSRLFQKSQLFDNLTVRENLLLALDNEDTKFWKNLFGKNKITKEKEEQVKKALQTIRLSHYANTQGRELSFGQKRLVEIMRTILKPHTLLMFDEPVAGVTPQLRDNISKIFKQLKQDGATILLIEHDMNFALNMADEVIVLDNGKLIAGGSPEEIRNNKLVLEAYLGN